MGQRLYQIAAQSGALSAKLPETYDNRGIEELFGDEEREREDEPIKARPANTNTQFLKTFKEESMLWHNNIPLPYQKKIKRE